MSSKKSKTVRTVIITVAIIAMLGSVFVLIGNWDAQRGLFSSDDTLVFDSDIEYGAERYTLREDIETVLVMGLDKFDTDETAESYNNNQQADFLMLFVLDNSNEICNAIHISRDTMADVNILGVAGQRVDTQKMQIALAHTYGNGQQVSLRNTADSVSALFGGIKIDHSISVTMDSVALINDMVGGVELTVLDDFTDVDASLVKGEQVLLKGDKALTYVRARKGLDKEDNESRMERQRQYLEALYARLMSAVQTDEDFAVKAVLQLSDYTVSNSHTAELEALSEKLTSYTFGRIMTIEGDSSEGEKYMEFYPDGDKLTELIISLFYTRLE